MTSKGMLIQRMGAQAISSDVVNVGAMFHHGLVDLIHMPAIAFKSCVDVLRQGRIAGAKAGLYSWRTLNLMKKARCQLSPAMAECGTPTESP